MARTALIESLRREAARDVEAVWQQARAQAARHRDELAAALGRERERLDAELNAELHGIAAAGAAEAEHRARDVRAAAVLALAERLLEVARAELPALRGAAPASLLEALAVELPPCAWQGVRVHPADTAAATRLFPAAAVEGDPAVSGGLDVECEDGRIRVSNSLETRLAAAWPDLLPVLVADLEARHDGDGTVA